MESRPLFVLFGGTFNPIHMGHMGLIRGLLARDDVGHLFAVPAARNPFKGSGRLMPGELRLAMVRAALQGMAGVSVLELELRREQPSYSIDTLKELTIRHPEADFRVAMGWDVYLQFHAWRGAEDILRLGGLWVVLRAGTDPAGADSTAGKLAGLPPFWRDEAGLDGAHGIRGKGGRSLVEFINLELPPISATDIRKRRDLDHVPEGARELLAAHWAEKPWSDSARNG